MPLTKQEIIALRETFLFHHLSDSTYLDFTTGDLPEFERLQFSAGETVEIPQSPEHCIAIVTAGALYATREPKFANRTLQEGFIIGTLDLFSSTSPDLPPITAVTDCQLLLISASQMKQIFFAYPELMLRYIHFLTGQLHALKWEHALATTSSGDTRLLQFLSQHMEETPEGCTVTLPYSFSVLAGRLSMSRATLYRTFDRLEEAGLLMRQGKTLVILQPGLLTSQDSL